MSHSTPQLALGLALTLTLAACGDPSPETSELPLDVPPLSGGSWSRPAADTTWQWQLSGPLALGYEVDLYDVDLFDAPDADLEALRAQGRTIICYFSAGSSESWRPDFEQIPDEAIGRKLSGWSGERWLDVRRRDVFDLMVARLDLAASRGCDGVEPDNVDGHTNGTGFGLTADDLLAYNRNLANAAHERGLAVGLKNDGGQAADLVDYYDFALNEQCHEYDECREYSVFLGAGKPVLNAEYPGSESQAQAARSEICAAATLAGTRTLILPLELDDTFRFECP
ncbi:MAG: endo alpha-1,4 polygalactosaminidase [Deltaproteobacteria bacterium]|nr:endo alpha-1,4 polygalactosaminidase [Deltaproteobacteria bacterium]